MPSSDCVTDEWSPCVVLLAPDTTTVIDTFRALGDFEEHYDLGALDALERRMGALIGPGHAKGVVSDALLFAFGLRRERERPLSLRTVGSRRATPDEYRLLTLLVSASRDDRALAEQACRALHLVDGSSLLPLAAEIARRFEEAGVLRFTPDPVLLGLSDQPFAVEVDRRARGHRRVH